MFLKKFSFGEDIRPLVTYLHHNRKEGEELFLNEFSEQQYRFYQRLYYGNKYISDYTGVFSDGAQIYLGKNAIIFGMIPIDQNISYITEDAIMLVRKNSSNRSIINPGKNWFLLAHTKSHGKEFLFNYLNTIGKRINKIQSDSDATLYLYDIYQNPISKNELLTTQ